MDHKLLPIKISPNLQVKVLISEYIFFIRPLLFPVKIMKNGGKQPLLDGEANKAKQKAGILSGSIRHFVFLLFKTAYPPTVSSQAPIKVCGVISALNVVENELPSFDASIVTSAVSSGRIV